MARKRTFGTAIEESDIGAKIQLRDLVHVLEQDGREKKSLFVILARLKNTDQDEPKSEPEKTPTSVSGMMGAGNTGMMR